MVRETDLSEVALQLSLRERQNPVMCYHLGNLGEGYTDRFFFLILKVKGWKYIKINILKIKIIALHLRK